MNFEIPPADHLTRKPILNPVEGSRSAPTRNSNSQQSVMRRPWRKRSLKVNSLNIKVSDVLCYKLIPNSTNLFTWLNKYINKILPGFIIVITLLYFNFHTVIIIPATIITIFHWSHWINLLLNIMLNRKLWLLSLYIMYTTKQRSHNFLLISLIIGYKKKEWNAQSINDDDVVLKDFLIFFLYYT